MAYAAHAKPYMLHVDASREGLNGVLYQEHDGCLRPVGYTPQVGVFGFEVDCGGHSKGIFYSAEFEVNTDNKPLTHVLTTAKLDAMGHQWLADH